MRRARRIEALGYVAVCLAMWGLPLLNRLHVESSAVLAACAFFLSGASALACFRERGSDRFGVQVRRGPLPGIDVRRAVASRLAILLLPLVLMLVPMLWAPNCGWRAGIGFFGLFVPPSALLGVAVAAVLSRTRVKRPLAGLVAAGVVIVAAGVVFDLGFHPQFYTYNHVFGGILGPIYDEQLAVRSGLFWFRAMTVLWAVIGLAWSTGRGRLTGVLLLVQVGAYLYGGRLGINTGYDDLERALPDVHESGPFRFHFEGAPLDPGRIAGLAAMARFEYDRITEVLGVMVDEPISVYVYPDAWTRARLTGARYTSVAPVWLARPQVHVEVGTFEAVFPHELVHAIAREFGFPLVNASPAVGLVEGLAVALEPPDGRPSPDELVLASITATGMDPSEALVGALSPWGFWTGRGGVSYTVTGSFVRYLLDAYPAAIFREAYRTGNVPAAYGRSLAALVGDWRSTIDGRSWVDAGSVRRARLRLGASSLFERTCPHFVPTPLRLLERAGRMEQAGRHMEALQLLDEAFSLAPGEGRVISAWVANHRRNGDLNALRDSLIHRDPEALPIEALIAVGDLRASEGETVLAADAYRAAASRLPGYARQTLLALDLRAAAAADPTTARWLLGAVPVDSVRSEAGQALVALSDQGDPSLLAERPPQGLGRGTSLASWTALRHWAIAIRLADQGQFAQAAEAAEQAAEAFRRAGDLTMEAYVRHVAARHRHTTSQSSAGE